MLKSLGIKILMQFTNRVDQTPEVYSSDVYLEIAKADSLAIRNHCLLPANISVCQHVRESPAWNLPLGPWWQLWNHEIHEVHALQLDNGRSFKQLVGRLLELERAHRGCGSSEISAKTQPTQYGTQKLAQNTQITCTAISFQHLDLQMDATRFRKGCNNWAKGSVTAKDTERPERPSLECVRHNKDRVLCQ